MHNNMHYMKVLIYLDIEGQPVELINRCAYQGKEIADELYNRETRLENDIQANYINYKASEETLSKCKNSYSRLLATKLLQKEAVAQGMCPYAFKDRLHKYGGFSIQGSAQELCRPNPPIFCHPGEIYRRLDGSCNNLEVPEWGKSNTALERLLSAYYADGVYTPALSVSGNLLPSARLISTTLYHSQQPHLEDQDAVDVKWTQAYMLFGQYLSHDFALTLSTQTSSGGIKCCNADDSNVLPQKQLHHACFPIQIPSNDYFYSHFRKRCLNFVRSMTISRKGCTLGPADQLNVVTSWLDGSPIYGSDETSARALRSFQRGYLLVQHVNGRDLPPPAGNDTFCDDENDGGSCFQTGDPRSNQHPQLTILQTIFMRHHNSIAEQLHNINPEWCDERLYQESRNIVIAVIQQITYYEWLPGLINTQYLIRHRVIQDEKGHSNDYDKTINGGTLNVFTAGAFRYLHSNIPSHQRMLSEIREPYGHYRLSAHLDRPSIITERYENFDGILRGTTSNLMMATDNMFSTEITNYLFAGSKPFGSDLESLDIQRGRDHGLQPYLKYREFCGLPAVHSFEDLRGSMSEERISKLRLLYRDVRDIDMFVGAIAEYHVNGGQLGPTIQCIVAEQFYRWRVGDRFFFESKSNPNPLTSRQLRQIKKITMARLFCDHGDHIQSMQRMVFMKISKSNPLLSCHDDAIPKLDLDAWRDFA